MKPLSINIAVVVKIFRQDGIGPQLGGLTTFVSADWLKHFITNPQKVIESGDKRARRLFNKYKVVMPSVAVLKDDEVVLSHLLDQLA